MYRPYSQPQLDTRRGYITRYRRSRRADLGEYLLLPRIIPATLAGSRLRPNNGCVDTHKGR